MADTAHSDQTEISEQSAQPTELSPVQSVAFVYDTWYQGLEKPIQDGLTAHMNGLKSALENERTARKQADKDLKKLRDAAEEGSALRQQLDKAIADYSATRSQSRFYEEANAQGVRHLKLAYLALKDDGLIDEDGEADWKNARTRFPELFAAVQPTKTPPANGGAGRDTPVSTAFNMNTWLREQAGHR